MAILCCAEKIASAAHPPMPARIAWGNPLYLLTKQVEGGAEESLPPHTDTLLLTSLRLQR